MTKARLLFYQLVEAENRTPWGGAGISAIELTDAIENVAQLRSAIYAAHPRLVQGHVQEHELQLSSGYIKLDPHTLLRNCELALRTSLTVAVVANWRDLYLRSHEPQPKRTRQHRTAISADVIQSATEDLDIETWQATAIVPLRLHRIEPDFPQSLYIRQAMLDIFEVYCRHRDSDLQTVFVGAPGVGKSVLLVLFAIYRAVCEKKRVVLFRRFDANKYSLLYLDVEENKCWRIDHASLADLDELRYAECELFLDGFTGCFMNRCCAGIDGYRFHSSSELFEFEVHRVYRKWCLVPGWSKSELAVVGQYLGKSDVEIDSQYYYSGGNLCDFQSDEDDVKREIDAAVHELPKDPIDLLDPRSGLFLPCDIDRVRMPCIVSAPTGGDEGATPGATAVDKYTDLGWWTSVITSQYALTLLRDIAPVDLYKQLWDKGYKIGDAAIQVIAFENYVDSHAMKGKTITLEMRSCDGKCESVSVEMKPKPVSKAERSSAEGNKSAEYVWHPVDCCPKTIGNLAHPGTTTTNNTMALLQTSTSATHKVVLQELKAYPPSARIDSQRWYVMVVPDKQTYDVFRYEVPKGFKTIVKLCVAYVKDWATDRAPRALSS